MSRLEEIRARHAKPSWDFKEWDPVSSGMRSDIGFLLDLMDQKTGPDAPKDPPAATAHTPEPRKEYLDRLGIDADGNDTDTQLTLYHRSNDEWVIYRGDDNDIATCLNEAEAKRIVACVNACAGLSTEALEAGALGKLASACRNLRDDPAWDNEGPSSDALAVLLDSLTKLEGK